LRLAQISLSNGQLERVQNIRRLIHIARDFGVSIQPDDGDISFLDSICRGRYPAEEGLLPLSPPSVEDANRAPSIAGSVLRELQVTRGDVAE
jgi:hypothetical protein